jgi:hypothetical protein
MKLLVGSSAAKQWFPDFRDPRDIDFFITDPAERVSNSRGIEYFHHPLLAKWMIDNITPDTETAIAEPDFLYTIKVSHAFWGLKNNSWEKHMHDVMWLQDKGCQIVQDFYDVLYAVWEEVHGKKKANLNVPASEFFTAAVQRKYDHDSIHASIAYGDRPLFEKILRDGSEVAVAREKFEALSHEDKCRLVREEVYATALERILIPSGFTKSPRAAYAWALRQTVTSFSKGWFPFWIVTNFKDVRRPDCDFVQRHKDNSDRLISLEA